MAYAFNDDRSKGIIKTKTFTKTNVSGGGTTTVTVSAEDLDVESLLDVTILELRECVITPNTVEIYGGIIGGRYLVGNQIYPNLLMYYHQNTLIIRGYNWDDKTCDVIFEITYLVADVDHIDKR